MGVAHEAADVAHIHARAPATFHQSLGFEDRDGVADGDRGNAVPRDEGRLAGDLCSWRYATRVDRDPKIGGDPQVGRRVWHRGASFPSAHPGDHGLPRISTTPVMLLPLVVQAQPRILSGAR